MLEPTAHTPDELIVTLKFPDKSSHDFKVPTVRFLDYSITELEERKLSILLPFYLLKLRKRVKAAESREKRLALSGDMKKLVGELTKTLESSEQMSKGDMRQVIELMGRLYDELYKAYPEFKESNSMVDY